MNDHIQISVYAKLVVSYKTSLSSISESESSLHVSLSESLTSPIKVSIFYIVYIVFVEFSSQGSGEKVAAKHSQSVLCLTVDSPESQGKHY